MLENFKQKQQWTKQYLIIENMINQWFLYSDKQQIQSPLSTLYIICHKKEFEAPT